MIIFDLNFTHTFYHKAARSTINPTKKATFTTKLTVPFFPPTKPPH